MADSPLRLHETTQRGLLRMAYLIVAMSPLAVCFWLSCATLVPGYVSRQAARWERRFNELYGLTFSISEVRTLAPYCYSLQDIKLAHPETQRPMGTIEQAQVQLKDGQWVVKLTGVQVQWEQFDEAWHILHDWYMCRPGAERQRAMIEADRLTIVAEGRSLELKSIAVQVLPESNRWGLKASFLPSALEHQSGADASQLLLVRHHDPHACATEIQLRATTQLPSWLVLPLLWPTTTEEIPSLSWRTLSSSYFTGLLDIRSQKNGTAAYLVDARLSQLEMGQVTSNDQAIISGRGELHVARAMLSSQGLQWAEGTFEMAAGRIDASFLNALGRNLDIQLPRKNPVGITSFDRMSASFRIIPQELQVVGLLSPDGALLVDAHGPLAARRDESPLPIENLVYSLVASQPALGRRALVWLPMDEAERKRAASELRISRNEPVANDEPQPMN